MAAIFQAEFRATVRSRRPLTRVNRVQSATVRQDDLDDPKRVRAKLRRVTNQTNLFTHFERVTCPAESFERISAGEFAFPTFDVAVTIFHFELNDRVGIVEEESGNRAFEKNGLRCI